MSTQQGEAGKSMSSVKDHDKSSTTMKTVLVIAYHFPPGGGPGVQRVLKHITYLHEAGWRPVVLTVQDGDFPARDESLLSKIPSNVRVVRVPIFEPYKYYRRFMGGGGAAIDVNVNKSGAQRRGWKAGLAEFVRATFFIPDARIGWLRNAVHEGIRLVKEEGIDAIYTSSPPYTCALIGRNIKRRTGLPWVAGFRDPWTGFLTTPDRWWLPSAIDKSLERSVFTEADAVECAWEGIIDDAVGKYPSLDRTKFHHVPNGYDSSDFPAPGAYPRPSDNRFTITYTGSMYGRRNPATFLAALDLLVQQHKLGIDDLRLRFVGRFGDDVNEMLAGSQFASAMDIISYVPHEESIAMLMASDASLLIVDDAKESAEIVPGKVYEYLGVGKPIIALTPRNSAIERLVRETRAGLCAAQDDIPAIAEIIGTYVARWREGTALVSADPQAIAKYERRVAAHQLGSILSGLVS